MKLLLPVGVLVFAAGFCCCGGDFEKVLREAGIDIPNTGATDGRVMFAVPGNERVQILEIASDDAYYTDRATIVGVTCTTDGESTHQGEGWHGGSVQDCDNGSTYYFYKAAYMDKGPAAAVAVVPGLPGLRATRPLPSGTRVKVLDVHTDDAFASDRATIMGKTCLLSGESTLKDVEWHGGQVDCDDSSSYYFYKAAYEELDGGTVSATPAAPPPNALNYSLPKGTRIVIADVASDDAYFESRSGMIGKRCTMDEQSVLRDVYWHGGQVVCDDGSSYYFLKGAFQAGG